MVKITPPPAPSEGGYDMGKITPPPAPSEGGYGMVNN